ncbi:MAG TPA: S49 family peptidase [Candidatus Limnocylindria bacterium]|nr:S49 family peptidase [Candidatus Limnocylindria bacterium]
MSRAPTFARALSRGTFALTLISSAGAAAAAVTEPAQPIYGHESAAAADGANGFLFNPASAGPRYPSELILSWTELEPTGTIARALASFQGFGFGFQHQNDNATSVHLGLAGGDDRLRLGATTTWTRSAPTGDRALDLSLGALSRPTPWLSLGAVAEHVAEPSLDGERLDRTYAFGVGLRPLAFDRARAHTLGTRFTLTADARLGEGQRRDDARVRFGAELELLAGLVLRGAIEDRGGVQLGVGLLGSRAGYHGQSAYDRDRDRRHTTHSLSFHDGEDRTTFTGRGERRVAVLRLGGTLGDESTPGSLLGEGGTVAAGPIHEFLERALDDRLTHGVLLQLEGVINLSQLEELKPRIRRLRDAGKPVVAYFPYGARRGDLYLASACDRIVASEEAVFHALGLRVERRYYRKLLDELGVRMDRTAYGPYKSFYANLSTDSTNAAEREEIERILDVVQEQFVSTVATDRRMPRERLLELLDGRHWRVIDVQSAGLVDSIGDRADALRILGELTGLGDKPRTVRLSEVAEAQRAWTVAAPIAIVYASGDMETGRSEGGWFSDPTLGSETLARQLEDAFEDPDVKVVVLRIESGGGAAVAASLMHRAAERLKREHEKPLIVSMGRVAASGGYLLAVAGDRIYANRATYTGSIGVVFLKPSLEKFYARHDVRQDAFERGRSMRGWSLGEDWDRALQASADSATWHAYRRFVSKVAAGRARSEAEVDSVAKGRVWMGDDALARGLVDEIGGLEQAVAEARRRAGIPAGEKIRLLRFGRPEPSFFQRLVGSALRESRRSPLRLPEPGAIYYWCDVEATP